MIVLCFSVDSRISFANTKLKWEPEITSYLPNVPIVLVGNKCDLKSEKTVTADEGWKMADTINAVAYLECSAKTHFGVRKVFDVAVRAAIQKESKQKRSCCALL